jgi:hypothetical protein
LNNLDYSFRSNISVVLILFVALFSSSYIFFRYPFEFYFHYLLILTLFPVFIFKNGIPKFLFILFSYLAIIGLINVLMLNNSLFNFMKVYGGLLVISYFFYSLLFHYDFKINLFFYWYCKLCLILSFIGLIQFFSFILNFKFGYDFSFLLNKWRVIEGGLMGIRVNSILAEPSQLGIVLSPAVYVSVSNLVSKENYILNKFQSLIVIFIVVLTASTIAYAGLLFSILLCTKTFRIRYLLIGILLSVSLFFISYKYVNEFKLRVDAAKALWIDNNFEIKYTNNSSFVLYNNLNVAIKNLSDYPFFGTGLGSHEYAFKKYTLTKSLLNYDFEFNVKDGNSLFIRLCTEAGLFGLFFIFYIIYYGFIYQRKNIDDSDHRFEIISHSLLIIIILSLLRQGNYMLNGLPLVFLLYYYNGRTYKTLNE